MESGSGPTLVAATAFANAARNSSWIFSWTRQRVPARQIWPALGTKALAEPGTTIINTHDSGSGETALHIVTARRDLTWMSFLLGRGADANARDNRGVTPLVVASNLGFVEGVDVLIQGGARVDESSVTGETPLIAAVHRRDLAMMRVLLKAGANPDRSDNTGRTARDYAQLEGKGGALLNEIEASAKTKGGKTSGSYGPVL